MENPLAIKLQVKNTKSARTSSGRRSNDEPRRAKATHPRGIRCLWRGLRPASPFPQPRSSLQMFRAQRESGEPTSSFGERPLGTPGAQLFEP